MDDDDGRRVSSVPLNYSMTGHVPTTLAHAAAHKSRISQKLLGYTGLNAGGAKVPLPLNNIRWNTGNVLPAGKTPEKTINQQLSCGPVFYWFMALCAAAWLDVAQAYPCTEYSGSGTETIRKSTQTQGNWKLSCIHFIIQEFMKRTCSRADLFLTNTKRCVII